MVRLREPERVVRFCSAVWRCLQLFWRRRQNLMLRRQPRQERTSPTYQCGRVFSDTGYFKRTFISRCRPCSLSRTIFQRFVRFYTALEYLSVKLYLRRTIKYPALLLAWKKIQMSNGNFIRYGGHRILVHCHLPVNPRQRFLRSWLSYSSSWLM